MELKDTVKGMMSDDYKERMAAEYHQTKIRYEKLKKLNTRMEAKVICTSSAPSPSWMVRPHACCVISSALWGSIFTFWNFGRRLKKSSSEFFHVLLHSTAKALLLCPPQPHEAGAGNFHTQICPAWRKTVQPKRMRPA